MPSPDDSILDEPQRFHDKLKFKDIEISKNPQKEFLKQMEKRWNQKAGLYLWKYFEKYELMNAVYKNKYKKDLDINEFNKYFEKFKEKEREYQRKIEYKRIKIRKSGKKIKLHIYTSAQINFIKSKKKMPLYWLATDFNRYFNTKLSRSAIRDKRLRILGRKS
jgi:hypothetical protein